MENIFTPLIEKLVDCQDGDTAESICKDILNNLQSKEAQNLFTGSIQNFDFSKIEGKLELFNGNRFAALLVF